MTRSPSAASHTPAARSQEAGEYTPHRDKFDNFAREFTPDPANFDNFA